ncbi:MAG: hypothetical protein KBT48_01760 [Firmicutes bacterium]|nr:hypothetical protein [Bacillota bacterium]
MKIFQTVRNYGLLLATCCAELYMFASGLYDPFTGGVIHTFISMAIALGLPAATAYSFYASYQDEQKDAIPVNKKPDIPKVEVDVRDLYLKRMQRLKKSLNAEHRTYFNRYLDSLISQLERFETKKKKLAKYNSGKVETITNNFHTILYRNIDNSLTQMEDFDHREYQEFIMGKLFLSQSESERKKKVFEKPFLSIMAAIDKNEEYLLKIDELLAMLQEARSPQEWDNDTLIALKKLDDLTTEQEDQNEMNRTVGQKIAKQYKQM